METYDEWYYIMLLDLLKQKEKSNTLYQQVELGLPLIEQAPEIREENKKNEIERGVVVIDYNS